MDNASPLVNAPEISNDNLSTSSARAPPTSVPASAGSGSSGKRPRAEEAVSDARAKKLRTETTVAPATATALTAEQPATNIKKVSAKADKDMPTAPEVQNVKSTSKKVSPLKPQRMDKAAGVTATGGTSDAAAKGSNVVSGKADRGSKSAPSKTNSAGNGGKVSPRASPRRPPEDPEVEKPLDLVAIRQFEYDQVSTFGPSQQKRYENYRRSDLKKEKVKKVLVALNPALAKASDQFLIAVKGLAKVFVGDVVETALEVKAQLGDTGALQPKHLREAYRRLRRNGALPSSDAGPSALG